MALLEINNLTKKYGKFVALDGVNLSLGEGKIVGLLGPNGSGKTTLMKCVAGLLTPDGGSITVDGNPIGAETKKIVSFLPERTYLRPTQTVASVLEYFSLFYEDFDVSAAEKHRSTPIGSAFRPAALLHSKPEPRVCPLQTGENRKCKAVLFPVKRLQNLLRKALGKRPESSI